MTHADYDEIPLRWMVGSAYAHTRFADRENWTATAGGTITEDQRTDVVDQMIAMNITPAQVRFEKW